MSDANTKTQKAAFCFAFLSAVKADPEMQRIDMAAAVDFIEIVGDDLTFYRSARMLAGSIRCAESTAEASLSRFRSRGYLHLAKTPKATSSGNGGRRANSFVMLIPDAVSPGQSGKTSAEVSPGRSGKTTKPHKGVSPGQSGSVSPDQPGTITIEKPLEGGRAQGRASASPSESGFQVIEDDLDLDADATCGLTALEAPTPASSDPFDPDAWRSFPAFAADFSDGVPVTGDDVDPDARDGFEDTRASATLDDLEGWDREEMEAAISKQSSLWLDDDIDGEQAGAALRNDPTWRGVLDRADKALEMIWCDADLDFRRHTIDAVRGLADGVALSAQQFRHDLARLLDGAHPTRRSALFENHLAVMETVFADFCGGRRNARKVIARFTDEHGAMVKGASHG